METDVERRWHQTHVSDSNAKPMLGRLSGTALVIFLGSVALAAVVFVLLSQLFHLGSIVSLTISGALPAATMTLLLRYMVGKPENYAIRLLETLELKQNQSPLLSGLESDEN